MASCSSWAIDVAQSTVSIYMVPRRDRPLQTWKAFVRNHMEGIASIDLFVVPTIAFQHLFAFLVLGHERRRLLWFAVTRNPTAEWLARQITEAFPWDSAPKYLIRDNDRAFGVALKVRIRAMGIRDRPTSFRSPWQNRLRSRILAVSASDAVGAMLITSRVITSRAMRPWVFVYSRASALLSEKNVNHHEPRCSPIANACRIKSPSLTMPTTPPSAATTGTPLMRLACRIWAISGTGVSGATVTTSRVMTSAAVSTAAPPSIRSARRLAKLVQLSEE
jgi:hypothetical protein